VPPPPDTIRMAVRNGPHTARRDLMEMLTTVVIVQDLYRRGVQRANLVPDPRSSIRNHTEAYLRFRNQPGSFHLPERGTQFRIGLYLLPTQDVFEPRLHDQVQAESARRKSLGAGAESPPNVSTEAITRSSSCQKCVGSSPLSLLTCEAGLCVLKNRGCSPT
jgi:hypothetical protein